MTDFFLILQKSIDIYQEHQNRYGTNNQSYDEWQTNKYVRHLLTRILSITVPNFLETDQAIDSK